MGRFKDILKASVEKTNNQLASEISSLTRLTDAQIKSVCPARVDKESLLRLLEIVNSATEENTKIKQLKDNIETLAGTVIKVLRVLA
jgi:hypothetical protein